jgi:hypothetical protein
MSAICDLLKDWDNLATEDKIEVLEEISKEFLEEFGLDDEVLKVLSYDTSDMNEKPFSDHTTDFGYYDKEEKIVWLNENKLDETSTHDSAKEAIDTIYHETMHYIYHVTGVVSSTGVDNIDNMEGTSFEGYYDEDGDMQLLAPGEVVISHDAVEKIAEDETKLKMDECKSENKDTDEGYNMSVPSFEIEIGEPTVTSGSQEVNFFDFTQYSEDELSKMFGE